MKKCTCALIIVGIITIVIAIILLSVLLTRDDGLTLTTIVTTTKINTTTTFTTSINTATTWPTMNALPLGTSFWKVILEVDVNMPFLNTTGQVVTTITDGTDWLRIYSVGPRFSIDISMILVSSSYAYYDASSINNPLYIFLTPDLIHSNAQCILRINTYVNGTTFNGPMIPVDPISSLVLILSLMQ